MPDVIEEARIEERVAQLERRFEQLVGPLRADPDEGRPTAVAEESLAAAACAPAASARPPACRDAVTVDSLSAPSREVIGSHRTDGPVAAFGSSRSRDASLADLIGGRLL